MPTEADIAAARRGNIEQEFNALRDTIEKTYISDKVALEATYHSALKANANAKRAAFVTEGLNSDGTDPQGRPQG